VRTDVAVSSNPGTIQHHSKLPDSSAVTDLAGFDVSQWVDVRLHFQIHSLTPDPLQRALRDVCGVRWFDILRALSTDCFLI
jgi:hypothetical protein